ncbi:MAG: 2-octaprenyl-3-methyl-6-methoxy-1,4-benzoquinol hydroxylase [Gammaproteobacteria bacterium RIFCSPHIGHO2_12_FULL_41_15]|nr:MAG: 2-octaprenyl-3-methyl-6-methoxy-1,4-benzoquinol hydroxylase [Gammaproteobacteria bacterium RIFCSPHIGHO2_12_FULL_41_15]
MKLSFIDNLIVEFDTALSTIFPPLTRNVTRPNPDQGIKEEPLTQEERQHSIGLMRVNHSGEVCAQALYQGQALVAAPTIQAKLKEAQFEEVEHLAWCEKRLKDLSGSVSLLNPVWYLGSLVLGAGMGLLGSKISLGFVIEVERQVEAHLASHLEKLPLKDKRSRAIVSVMQQDEALHRTKAKEAGGVEFPLWAQQLMQYTAKCMTYSSYYL